MSTVSHQTFDPAAAVTVLSAQMDALGAGAGSALGSVVADNATDLWPFGAFQLDVTFAAAPTADSTIDLFVVYAFDGTNYNNGGGTSLPANAVVGGWNMAAITTQQLLTIGVLLMPFKFKVFVYDNTNRAFPATGSTVKYVGYGLKSTTP